MSDKLEALRLEAETLSGLMMQLAENEIDSDSFAVMSDLGENGQEHDCDLLITETALRASAVIDQLLAALEEARKNQRTKWDRCLDAEHTKMQALLSQAERREEHLKADVAVMGKRIAELEQNKPPIIPEQGSIEVNDAAWKLHDMLTEHGPLNGHQFNNLKGCFYEALKVCFKVEGG